MAKIRNKLSLRETKSKQLINTRNLSWFAG